MYELELENAVSEIHQACENRNGSRSPFFFIVGAGISAPTIPIASEIESECKAIAINQKRTNEPKSKNPLDSYSHWFEAAWPNAEQRQQYLRRKIERRLISPAALRLAHLLLNGAAGNLVVTPNFDDFLSKALTLFGQPHIICDHPSTISRVSIESEDLKIVHVHGTYWFYDCVNLKGEITERADSSPRAGTVTIPSFLELLLWNRSPIVLGYSGWEGDAIMTALQKRLKRAMGFNIYWFCYKRSDCDSLPLWLKDHPSVRFILPKIEMTSAPTKDTETAESDMAAPQALKSDGSTIETLPAVRVLDLLNRSFKLDPPPLTENPLDFFADQLTKSIFPDEADQLESDFYDFKNVIARVQAAAKLLKGEEATRSEIELALEGLRNAVRRSEYREAIKIAMGVPRTSASAEQLEEIQGAASAAAENLADNSPEEFEGYDTVCEIGVNLAGKNKLSSVAAIRWARALVNKGATLAQLGRREEEIAVYEEVVQRFGDATEPAVREQVARALGNKGVTLARLNRNAAAIAVYEDVVRRFGDATEPSVREQLARALRNKGVILGLLNRNEEAIAVYEEVVRRFGDGTEPALRAQVAMSLRNEGFMLGQLKRSEEAIAAYEEVVRRFGDGTEPAVREQVAMALRNKGFTLGQLKRSEEEISAYEEVVRRFGDTTEPAVREQVAISLRNKGIRLGVLKRSEEAIAAYEEVVRRFGDATEPAVREQVAMALRNKGIRLHVLRRSEEAIAAYEDVVRRFGDATEPGVREQVAMALFNKGVTLDKLDRKEEAIATYREMVQRFGDATELSLPSLVVEALLSQAKILKETHQAIMVAERLTEIVERYSDNADAKIQGFVAEAKKLMIENAKPQVAGV